MSNITSPDSNGATKYFVNYNQDSTSLSIGSKDGFRLFSLTDAENIEQIYSNDQENIFMVERLFSSSLVALVATTSPRKLKVCHFKKGTEICNYSYSDSILSVKMNRARLVVCLVESLYIHNIRDMKVLHTIRDTPQNPHGLCALTINSDSCCLLAYPGSASIGELQIFDALNLQSKTAIAAHDSPLAAIAFNPSGSRVATASEKGTVIRVFQTIDGAKLFEFRRGARCVEIGCLSFSMCSNFLACSSNTETVHIFKLEELKDVPKNNVDESSSSWMCYLSSYLPSQVTDVFNQGRAFATAHLSVSGGKNVVTIVTVQNQPMVLVTTSDGMLFVYPLDVNEGGDLLLKRQFRLYDVESDTKAVPIQDQADDVVYGYDPATEIAYEALIKKRSALNKSVDMQVNGEPLLHTEIQNKIEKAQVENGEQAKSANETQYVAIPVDVTEPWIDSCLQNDIKKLLAENDDLADSLDKILFEKLQF